MAKKPKIEVVAAKPPPEKDPESGRFLPGNSGGPGRTRGARNKLGEAFVADMLADWEKNGAETIKKVRADRPQDYLKVVASILPKELNLKIGELEELSDEELDRRIKQLAVAVADEIGPGEIFGGEATQAPTQQTRPI